VADEVDFCIEPLGALDAVVLAQARQVFSRVAVLMLGEMLGREQVGLDLVDVSVSGVSLAGLDIEVLDLGLRGLPGVPPSLGQCLLVSDAHLDECENAS